MLSLSPGITYKDENQLYFASCAKLRLFTIYGKFIFVFGFPKKAIESSLVAKKTTTTKATLAWYRCTLYWMFVSAAAGGGFLVPLEPTVSGKNRTAKDDTHDTTIGWDSLVLYSKGLIATSTFQRKPFDYTVSSIPHHVSKKNYKCIINIFSSKQKHDHWTQCKAKWALDQSHKIL